MKAIIKTITIITLVITTLTLTTIKEVNITEFGTLITFKNNTGYFVGK